MDLRKKEVVVFIGAFMLFLINACVVLYLRFFARQLFESLPAYPHYMAIRAILVQPDVLIASAIAIYALFLGYRKAKRKNAPEQFQLLMLGLALGAAFGSMLIMLW
jgi:hypothetical protein